jgi:hypothetical protein
MIKEFPESQAAKPGFWSFKRCLFAPLVPQRMKGVFAVLLGSVMLVGSCNTQGVQDMLDRLGSYTSSFADMGKGELMRHAYALQGALAQNPSLLGKLSGKDVTLMLAAPDLERRDAPSVVWQYRSSRCVLDVYYTAQGEAELNAVKVSHYELRARDLITNERRGDVEARSCLQSIYNERRPLIEAGFEQMFAAADGRRG